MLIELTLLTREAWLVLDGGEREGSVAFAWPHDTVEAEGCVGSGDQLAIAEPRFRAQVERIAQPIRADAVASRQGRNGT
jgi:hypothetical protein